MLQIEEMLEEDDDDEINGNKSNIVSIPDQEDIYLRIKQPTKGGSEESSDDSRNENQPDS